MAASRPQLAPCLAFQRWVTFYGEKIESPFPNEGPERFVRGNLNRMTGLLQANAQSHIGLDIAASTSGQDGDAHRRCTLTAESSLGPLALPSHREWVVQGPAHTLLAGARGLTSTAARG
jgi:hypothetical protein